MQGVMLVIPAWDEAESIGAVLDEVPPGCVEQVLVVVASADDPTARVARAHGAEVLVQHGRGYGAACWSGAQAALERGARVVAFLDGDYADPPADLPRVLAPLLAGRVDVVLGCRDLHQHPRALPAHARLGNALVLLLMRLLYGRRYTDLPSFKAVRADVFQSLDMREMTYGWTVEMLAKAARAGLRVEEVSIAYRPRLGGSSKVAGSLRGSLAAAAKLISCAVGYAAWRPPAPQPGDPAAAVPGAD
jgi:glycosyltransferase involved in cell wall biosynthesis